MYGCRRCRRCRSGTVEAEAYAERLRCVCGRLAFPTHQGARAAPPQIHDETDASNDRGPLESQEKPVIKTYQDVKPSLDHYYDEGIMCMGESLLRKRVTRGRQMIYDYSQHPCLFQLMCTFCL